MLNKIFIVSKNMKVLKPIVKTKNTRVLAPMIKTRGAVDSFLEAFLPKDTPYEKKVFLTLEYNTMLGYSNTVQYTAVVLESETLIDGYKWFDAAHLQDDLRVLSWPGKYTLLLNVRKLLSGDTDVIDIYNRRKELQSMNITDFFNELNKEASENNGQN